MIADTTFLSDFRRERERSVIGPARTFLARHRRERLFTTVISAGEIAVIFDSLADARAFLAPYRILRLTPEIAYVAAALDRELIGTTGNRLGENDNWIAGFCRYYGQPLVSRDEGFDRVHGLRRLAY
jgi:predicted nucleic acid-binding protein